MSGATRALAAYGKSLAALVDDTQSAEIKAASNEFVASLGRLPTAKEHVIGQARSVLPPARLDEKEGDYNERVAKTAPGYFLFDRVRIVPSDATSSIEACDLFTQYREFVHVKIMSRSSVLSHLFSQGSVAERTSDGRSHPLEGSWRRDLDSVGYHDAQGNLLR